MHFEYVSSAMSGSRSLDLFITTLVPAPVPVPVPVSVPIAVAVAVAVAITAAPATSTAARLRSLAAEALTLAREDIDAALRAFPVTWSHVAYSHVSAAPGATEVQNNRSHARQSAFPLWTQQCSSKRCTYRRRAGRRRTRHRHTHHTRRRVGPHNHRQGDRRNRRRIHHHVGPRRIRQPASESGSGSTRSCSRRR